MARLWTRRGLLERGLVVCGGLVVASAMPLKAEAAGHAWNCGAQFGPLHRYLYQTSPDPSWADGIIWRESRWDPSAENPYSGAMGLAQFLPSTWRWGCDRFSFWGDPWDPYDNIYLMNQFLAVGEYSHWSCNGEC